VKLEVFESKEQVALALSRYLESWCEKEGFRSIALSGGSTPKIWFDLLSEQFRDRLPWEELLFFWGDERCVPPTDPQSNYGMTQKHLLSEVPVADPNVFRIRGEDPPGREALRYGALLDEALPAANGLPQFDLVILGMGDDGHTASIFPHEGYLWDEPANCVVATHPDSGQQRISLTGRVINNARQVVFLVTGANKAEKVGGITSGLPGYRDFPAARVAPESGRLLWLLDTDAASERT
jgi:6-phosphogluconolactonase